MLVTTTSKAIDDIETTLQAGYAVVLVETWEEERLQDILTHLAEKRDQGTLWLWSPTTGFATGPGADKNLTDPLAALAFVKTEGAGAISLFKDLPGLMFDNPLIKRALRDIYDAFAGQPGSLFVSHPMMAVPVEIAKEVFYLALPLPERHELIALLESLNNNLPADQQYQGDWLHDCAVDMAGLTLNEAKDLFTRLHQLGVQDREEALGLTRQQRAQLLKKESCLDVVDVALNLDQLGGLGQLKKWIQSRHTLFGPEAREAGIEPPSGILMMGVSGCGKSLAAKAIASAWNLTLARVDMNLVMSGAWGSPEQAWGRVLKSLDAVAPVVVWFDEIENCFGYINGQASGGNQTIFSSFLTWMQEKTSQVFVVATANRIELLPAEMLRKGRFDELFFLDLPKEAARQEILAIHVRNQGGNPDELNLAELAPLLDGWTAAEIEQLVRAVKLEAFYEKRQFNFTDLKNASFKMVPLSKTMSEQVNELRRWSRHRAVPAD